MTWDGLGDKQIAACMGLAETTLKGYKANIFKKWGVHGTVEMIRQACERGIVRPTTYRQQFCEEEWPGMPDELDAGECPRCRAGNHI